jgi:hypothetical protein
MPVKRTKTEHAIVLVGQAVMLAAGVVVAWLLLTLLTP